MSSTHRVAPRRPWLGSGFSVSSRLPPRPVDSRRGRPRRMTHFNPHRVAPAPEPRPLPGPTNFESFMTVTRRRRTPVPRNPVRSTCRIGSVRCDVRLETMRGILSSFPTKPRSKSRPHGANVRQADIGKGQRPRPTSRSILRVPKKRGTGSESSRCLSTLFLDTPRPSPPRFGRVLYAEGVEQQSPGSPQAHPGNVASPRCPGLPLLRRTPTGSPQPDAPVRIRRKR
jgi:hypothetical protein